MFIMRRLFSLILLLIFLTQIESKGYSYPSDWKVLVTSPYETTPNISWRTGQRYFTRDRSENKWRANEYQPVRTNAGSWRSVITNEDDDEDQPSSRILYWDPLCEYPRENCGMQSQEGLGAEFESAYTFFGNQYEKVALVESKKATSSAARLITPYVKSHNREEICFVMEYLMQGPGIESMTIIQQDRRETRPVYTVDGAEKRNMWRIVKMDLVLREGINRYFVEVRIKRQVSGMFMVRQLHYESGRCQHEESVRSQLRRSRLMDKYWTMTGR